MPRDLLFNLAMAALDAAVIGCLYRSRTAGAWWKAGLGAAGGAIFLVVLFGFRLGPLVQLSFRGYRSFFVCRLVTYVILLHAPICLAAAAVLLRKTARKTAALSAIGVLAALALAVDTLWIEPHWLDVAHVTIESPKLARPIRVALLADLQAEAIGPYERNVLERLRDEKPDLILLAGDYLQSPDDRHWERIRDELNAMLSDVGLSAPLGIFAVQGNVDRLRPSRRSWTAIFEGLPVVPVTASTSFDLGPLRLTCLAMYDSFNPRLRVDCDDLEKFHLVLGHSPDYALGEVDADLLLAGHTHGGQVRLPWIGALSSGCSVPTSWAAGLTGLPAGSRPGLRMLYVTRGAGMERASAPRVRLLCRPELTILELVPEERD